MGIGPLLAAHFIAARCLSIRRSVARGCFQKASARIFALALRPIHIDGMVKTSLWARLSGEERSLDLELHFR